MITIVNAQSNAMNLRRDFFKKGETPAREIALDLKKPESKDFLLQSVLPHIDVLLESYRPGVMEKLGLSPEVVHAVNPKVIYGRLSGFGQGSFKYRERAGHDINYLALTGVLNKFKRNGKGNAPTPPANIVADFASGSMHLFSQVL